MKRLFQSMIANTQGLRSRFWLGQLIAVVLSLAAIWIRFLIGDVLTGFPFLTFFSAVVFAAFLGGRNAGITAAVMGGLLSDYYLIEPMDSFVLVWPLGWIAMGFYTFTVTVIVLLMNGMFTALAEQKKVEASLQSLNAELEGRVERRTAALRASEARLRTIFETSFQFQGLLALDGSLLDANAASLRAINASLGDVLGKPFWETPWFTATPGMPELVRSSIPAVASGTALRQEIRVNLPEGGWRWFDFVMRPLKDAHGTVMAIVPEAVELTERRRAEEALRQAQKMEAVGQLSGGIAHDFNNMLSIVMGSLGMARRRLKGTEDPKLAAYLDSATEGAQRAATLTAQLLAFSRQQPLEPAPLDLNKLVGGISELLRRTLGDAIEIETVLGGGLWRAFADRAQLENAIVNLAINARDAMPDGGKLTIETCNADLDARYAESHSDVAAGQYVMLSVTDTGMGMSDETIERAFEPFFTTKPAGKGTGLGLSQVFGFVKQSRGHLKIYSEPGRGTAVKLYLPRHTATAMRVEPEMQNLSVVSGTADILVLVVEDDERVRQMTCDAVRELGYGVIAAADGARALDVLAAEPRVALLFTDIVMPGMSGRELADKATAGRPDLKVLYTTGYTRNAVVHNGTLDAGLALLPKPFTLQELAAKLRAVLGAAQAEPDAGPEGS